MPSTEIAIMPAARTSLTRLARPILAGLALVAIAVGLLATARPAQRPFAVATASSASSASDNLLLGNPDNAADSPQHFLLKRRQYSLSYNDSLHFPNWVAWRLANADIGNTERGHFQPDPDLPSSFIAVTPSDYTKSGYDRGHNCPSKDRSATRGDNDAVFYMSNITPQAHGMNAGPWEQFESYCRTLACQGNELYIDCGHGFDSPIGKRIGRSQVAVPDFGWKVVLVLPERTGNDLARITADTRVIAVRMPNINTIAREDWRRYKTSVGEIESATGLKFFTALPRETADRLRNRVDFDVSDPRRGTHQDRSPEAKPGNAGNPVRAIDPPATPAGADAGPLVWVNLRSGVYWMPGSAFYGKTKQGKYLSEKDAKAAGYRKANGQ